MTGWAAVVYAEDPGAATMETSSRLAISSSASLYSPKLGAAPSSPPVKVRVRSSWRWVFGVASVNKASCSSIALISEPMLIPIQFCR